MLFRLQLWLACTSVLQTFFIVHSPQLKTHQLDTLTRLLCITHYLQSEVSKTLISLELANGAPSKDWRGADIRQMTWSKDPRRGTDPALHSEDLVKRSAQRSMNTFWTNDRLTQRCQIKQFRRSVICAWQSRSGGKYFSKLQALCICAFSLTANYVITTVARQGRGVIIQTTTTRGPGLFTQVARSHFSSSYLLGCQIRVYTSSCLWTERGVHTG